MDRRGFWLIVLILAPLLAIGPALISGGTIGPFDQIATMAPWEAKPSERAWDILQADGALQFSVWRDLVFSSWRAGRIPAWNPYELGGTPLLANSQSAPFYPFHILLAFLPTGLAITLLAWIHLALGGLGMRSLVLRLGGTEAGGGFAGVAFALSPFMVAWTVLPSVITTCCWIPWILSFVISVYQGWRPGGPLLAGCVAMMMLAGHLQFAFYGLVAAILGVVWLSGAEILKKSAGGWKGLAVSVAAVLVGILISMPQTLPVREFSKTSHRQSVATEEGYQAFLGGAVKPFELPSLIAPGLMGAPGVAEEGVSGTQKFPTYWPMLVKPGANYAESALALGPAVLMGLFLLRKRLDWKRAGMVAVVGVFGFLLAMGTAVNAALYFGIPGFAASGSPGRASVLFVLAACALAGLAVSNPRDEEESAPRFGLIVPVGLVVLSGLMLAMHSASGSLEAWVPGANVAPQVATRLLEVLPLLVVSLAICIGAWYLWDKKRDVALSAGALVVGHLVLAQVGIIPFGSLPRGEFPEPDPLQRYAFVNDKWSFLSASKALMPPNIAAKYRLQDIAGYDSLMDRSTVEMMREINGGEDPAPAANGNIMYVKPGFDLAQLEDAGVTQIWSLEPIEREGLNWVQRTDVSLGTTLWVAITNGPGMVGSPKNDFSVTSFEPAHVEFQARGAGRFVYRTRNLPGWKAWVGGQPTKILPGRWLSIDLPDANCAIEFVYEPPGLRTGIGLGVLGLLLLIVWVPWAFRTQRDDDLTK